METINNIIYDLNSNPKTKDLARRIELARIKDEQRHRRDITDVRRLTEEMALKNIELYEKARCRDCIARSNLIMIRDLCKEIGAKYNPTQKKYHTSEIQTINKCFKLAVEALGKENKNGND